MTSPSKQIDKLRYTDPRAVQVREHDNVKNIRNAVYGTVAVYTESMVDTQVLIDNWEEIMNSTSAKINEILQRNE